MIFYVKLIVIAITLISYRSSANEVVKVFSDYGQNELDVFNNIIDNYIPIISRENPETRKSFIRKLKIWNPQIKDWTRIGSFTPINVYRQNPIYDISFGFETFSSNEKINSTQQIESPQSGLSVEFTTTFTHALNHLSFLNIKLLQKKDFIIDESDGVLKFPIDYNIDYGYMYRPNRTRWGLWASVNFERVTLPSYDVDRFENRFIILQNLKVNKNTIAWATAGPTYRFTIFKKGAYFHLKLAKSAYAKRVLEDNSFEESLSAIKATLEFKY